MSLKEYSKAHKKVVTVTAMIDPDKITYGKAAKITSQYKVGSGAPAAYKGHTGLDTASSDGSSIYSIYDGIVRVNAYEKDGAGYYVSIGTDMNNKNYRFMYMHLKKKSALKVGDKIKAGDFIGYQGNTGNSTGSHLHISLKVADNATSKSSKTADPYNYVMGIEENDADKIHIYETGIWTTLNKMNVRKGAGLNYEAVGSVDKDTTVEVLAVTSNGWGKIGQDKWICLEDSSQAYAKRIGDTQIADIAAYEKKLLQIKIIFDDLAKALK